MGPVLSPASTCVIRLVSRGKSSCQDITQQAAAIGQVAPQNHVGIRVIGIWQRFLSMQGHVRPYETYDRLEDTKKATPESVGRLFCVIFWWAVLGSN